MKRDTAPPAAMYRAARFPVNAKAAMHPWNVQPLPGERGCAMFESAIGHCGLAWRAEGLTQVLLGAVDAEVAAEALRWESGAELVAPPWPAFVSAAVQGMQALLQGRRDVDLSQVPLDWSGIGRFEREVYEATRRLPPGLAVTCDVLAQQLGASGAARAVDVALGRNPWPLVVPSHRVLGLKDERLGRGRPAGTSLRQWLLAIEAGNALATDP
jgi:methylated-DNA-[protein]-cysteine S-methyltransferase